MAMSKNSKANRKRRSAKEARHAKRRRAGGRSGFASMAGFFGDDELLTVSVIRSASGQEYPEEATIPIPDREVLAVVDDVSPADAERIAKQLSADIKAGEYPDDARVSVMGGWSNSSEGAGAHEKCTGFAEPPAHRPDWPDTPDCLPCSGGTRRTKRNGPNG